MSQVDLTNAVGIKMLSWIAPIYENSIVMKVIFQALGTEWEEAEEWVADIKAQFYPSTATWGLDYWEDRLGLLRNNSMTTEQRRWRVQNKILESTNINPYKLEAAVSNITGKACTINNYISAYTFEVVMEKASNVCYIPDILQMIKDRKPAHMSFELSITDEKNLGLYMGGFVHTGKTYTLTTPAL